MFGRYQDCLFFYQRIKLKIHINKRPRCWLVYRTNSSTTIPVFKSNDIIFRISSVTRDSNCIQLTLFLEHFLGQNPSFWGTFHTFLLHKRYKWIYFLVLNATWGWSSDAHLNLRVEPITHTHNTYEKKAFLLLIIIETSLRIGALKYACLVVYSLNLNKWGSK